MYFCKGQLATGKHKKKLYIIRIIFITLIMFYMLVKWIIRGQIEKDMGISDSSVIEIYYVPSYENCFFINVIDEYINNERLFFLSKDLFGWKCTLLMNAREGIGDVVDVVFHEWNNEVFVEVASSTYQGNGDIDIYKLDKDSVTLVLTVGAGVDRNFDLTTNSVYENGRLFVRLSGKEGQTGMPDIEVMGNKWVYGYSDPDNYTGEELLYQRIFIQYIYHWNSEEKKYEKIEEVEDILQQVDDVYPVDHSRG